MRKWTIESTHSKRKLGEELLEEEDEEESQQKEIERQIELEKQNPLEEKKPEEERKAGWQEILWGEPKKIPKEVLRQKRKKKRRKVPKEVPRRKRKKKRIARKVKVSKPKIWRRVTKKRKAWRKVPQKVAKTKTIQEIRKKLPTSLSQAPQKIIKNWLHNISRLRVPDLLKQKRG